MLARWRLGAWIAVFALGAAAQGDRGDTSAGAAARPPTLPDAAAHPAAAATPAPASGAAPEQDPAAAGREGPARPPQFVVVSFDGAGSVDQWEYWRRLGRETGARFTFFASGVYFLTADRGWRYHPPRRPAGTSDIGFLPVPTAQPPTEPVAYEAALLAEMSAGHAEGHEIGSHFNAHFCGPGGVATWSAADWASELDSFLRLLGDASANNGIDPPVRLSFGSVDVVGTRTPCLEGDMAALYPVLRSRQMRYDASQVAEIGDWPTRRDGIWSFPLASVPLAGTGQSVLSMDYNLYYVQTGAKPGPASAEPALEEQAYRTFQGYIDSSYSTSRAPVSIGAHFAHWNHDTYVRAITRIVRDNCGRPEVRCVTFEQLADWLDRYRPDS